MLIALMIASITDIRKREIPIWLFPLISVLFIMIDFHRINWFDSLTGLFIGIISFSIMAWKFSGGGGDILMMGTIGFVFGVEILFHITIIASLLCLIYGVIKKEESIPYAPFVTISYIICFIGGILYGNDNYRLLEIHYFLL